MDAGNESHPKIQPSERSHRSTAPPALVARTSWRPSIHRGGAASPSPPPGPHPFEPAASWSRKASTVRCRGLVAAASFSQQQRRRCRREGNVDVGLCAQREMGTEKYERGVRAGRRAQVGGSGSAGRRVAGWVRSFRGRSTSPCALSPTNKCSATNIFVKESKMIPDSASV